MADDQISTKDVGDCYNSGTYITSLGWSPDGKMIAASIGGETGPGVVKVWLSA
ncbi:hypothetical protein [Tengunoibacter tsumagoiensis]|uniref:hypothetical protein n=1 Tax=Tengunoibacter tsumagoiensis TaxID=2014871 RepID=UPI001386761B|nr:hypothetical protein [Tengunoibacter tsumagoiensis]